MSSLPFTFIIHIIIIIIIIISPCNNGTDVGLNTVTLPRLSTATPPAACHVIPEVFSNTWWMNVTWRIFETKEKKNLFCAQNYAASSTVLWARPANTLKGLWEFLHFSVRIPKLRIWQILLTAPSDNQNGDRAVSRAKQGSRPEFQVVTAFQLWCHN